MRAEATGGWDWAAARAICLTEARRVAGPGPAAEDAAQEAVLRAWRNQRSCLTPDAPAPWLKTIARREALRQLESRREAPDGHNDRDRGEDHAAIVAQAVDVTRALDALSAHERALVSGRYFEDLTQSALADRHGLPEGTTKVQLHRARQRLRGLLDPS